jgi:hypothetical protein
MAPKTILSVAPISFRVADGYTSRGLGTLVRRPAAGIYKIVVILLEAIELFDAAENEPVAAVLGQDNRFRQRGVAIGAEIAEEICGRDSFHRNAFLTRP